MKANKPISARTKKILPWGIIFHHLRGYSFTTYHCVVLKYIDSKISFLTCRLKMSADGTSNSYFLIFLFISRLLSVNMFFNIPSQQQKLFFIRIHVHVLNSDKATETTLYLYFQNFDFSSKDGFLQNFVNNYNEKILLCLREAAVVCLFLLLI